jgi:hypothetical protein
MWNEAYQIMRCPAAPQEVAMVTIQPEAAKPVAVRAMDWAVLPGDGGESLPVRCCQNA